MRPHRQESYTESDCFWRALGVFCSLQKGPILEDRIDPAFGENKCLHLFSILTWAYSKVVLRGIRIAESGVRLPVGPPVRSDEVGASRCEHVKFRLRRHQGAPNLVRAFFFHSLGIFSLCSERIHFAAEGEGCLSFTDVGLGVLRPDLERGVLNGTRV